MHFDYFTFLIYSPRGSSENAAKSRRLLGGCKNGNADFSRTLAGQIIEKNESSFFDHSVLVPVPRSTPTVEGAVFPSKVIAETLVGNGLGNHVSACLKRITPIPKSSGQYSAEARNSVQTHLDSLSVEPELIMESDLILIDDVLTLGRTAMASAIKLKESFPEKNIKIFCPFRTRSFEDRDILVKIEHGEMILSPHNKVILPD
jgi:predicted amidophosphoribosyltransferase